MRRGQAARVSAKGGQDKPRIIIYKTRSLPPCAEYAVFGVKVPRHLWGGAARDMAERNIANGEVDQVTAAEINGTGIMVSFDPDPAPPGLKAQKSFTVHVVERINPGKIVKTITQTEDELRVEPVHLVLKPGERFEIFVWRDQRTSAPRDPVGFTKMKIGHDKRVMIRNPERAGGFGM